MLPSLPPSLPLDELEIWLQWSGRVLLSMNIKSPFPKEPGCCWPEYVTTFSEAYGYTAETLRPPQPLPGQIKLMDTLLDLPNYIERVEWRRVVQMRLLITPVSFRQIYPFRRIAKEVHTSPQTAMIRYKKGLQEIVELLPPKKIHTIRLSFEANSLL